MFKIRENDHGMMSSQQPPCHLWSLPRPPQLTGPLTPPVWRETGNSFENFTCHCLLLRLKWNLQQHTLVWLKWMTKQRKLVRLKGRSNVRLNVILKAKVIVRFEGDGSGGLKEMWRSRRLLEDFIVSKTTCNDLDNCLSGPSGDALKRSEGAIAEGIYKEKCKMHIYKCLQHLYNLFINL